MRSVPVGAFHRCWLENPPAEPILALPGLLRHDVIVLPITSSEIRRDRRNLGRLGNHQPRCGRSHELDVNAPQICNEGNGWQG